MTHDSICSWVVSKCNDLVVYKMATNWMAKGEAHARWCVGQRGA